MTKKLIEKSTSSLAFLLLFGIGLGFNACRDEKTRVLPILGERELDYRMVDGKEVVDTIFHTVPQFRYLNHDSIWVTNKSFANKVWVVDFMFTQCPSICPPMTAQMKRFQNNTQDLAEKLQILSFTIDPERDTYAQLRSYRKHYDIEVDNWMFLRGDEDETHLIAKSFFNGAERNDAIDGGFGHTSYFALVDMEGYVRGIYDGTEATEVDRLEQDLRKLLAIEYDFKGSK